MKRSNSSDVDPRPLLCEDGTNDQSELNSNLTHPPHAIRNKHSRLLLVILFFSSMANIGLIIYRPMGPFSHEPRSKYAQLDSSLTLHIHGMTEYSNPNLTEARPLWDAINFDAGIVALPASWAAEKGLPPGQHFPWDKSKEIYVINSYHQLHCLNLHRSLREFQTGAKQSLGLGHLTHCLDRLRNDVMCYADDTPLYAPGVPPNGIGQHRQCRDWSKLDKWAKERTACFNYIGPKANSISPYKRFQFCPKDSPYWPTVREYFGKPDDWFGEDDEEIKASRES